MSNPTSDASGPITVSDGEQLMPRQRDQQPVSIMIHGRARPDQIEQAKLALMKIADPVRANPDCLEFRVYQDRDDPPSFFLWERWISEEAVFAHGKRDYMAEYMAQKDKLFESLDGHFCQEISPLDAAS